MGGEWEGDPTTVIVAGATVPVAAGDIRALRLEIEALDGEILRLVERRPEVSRRIGRARVAAGGPRVVHSREMAVLARFRELGSEGRDLALLLLRLGRGRSGRARRADQLRSEPGRWRGHADRCTTSRGCTAASVKKRLFRTNECVIVTQCGNQMAGITR
jgi:chorismate mutase